MVVISALKNKYCIFDGISEIEKRDPEEMPDFYADTFANTQKTTIIWQAGLSKLIFDILRVLSTMDYIDCTSEDPPVKSMPTRSYKYLIGSQGTAYRIIVRLRKVTIYVYNVDNMMANLHNNEIINSWAKDIDGDDLTRLTIATWKAIGMLGGSQEKRTPFTLSMRAMREWNRIEETWIDPDVCDAFTWMLPNGQSLETFIREAYFGGWCYINRNLSRDDYKRGGRVYDVNSLYPYVMRTKKIPHGTPVYFVGDIPNEGKDANHYFFIHCRIKARLKDGKHFPFLRKKKRLAYAGIDYITTTNYIDDNGKEIDVIGKGKNAKPVLLETTLTMTEYYMLFRHYDVEVFDPIDGVYFRATSLMFKRFVDEYYNMKVKSEKTGDAAGKRIAKMMLNSLSGTLAKVRERDNIIIRWNESMTNYEVETRRSISTSKSYIYMAAAITAYGREIAIETACENYDHFAYSDTDSAHIIGKRVKNMLLDDGIGRLGSWKIEKEFSDAYYIKPKTYIMRSGDDYHLTMAGLSYEYKVAIEKALSDRNLFSMESVLSKLDNTFYQTRRIQVDLDDPDYTIDGDSARDPFDGEIIETERFIDYPWQQFIDEIIKAPDIMTLFGYIHYPTGIETATDFVSETTTQWIAINQFSAACRGVAKPRN